MNIASEGDDVYKSMKIRWPCVVNDYVSPKYRVTLYKQTCIIIYYPRYLIPVNRRIIETVPALPSCISNFSYQPPPLQMSL